MSMTCIILRKCVDCGLEAYTTEDLEKFSANSASKYGRQKICKECYNTKKRKYWKTPEANKRKQVTKRRFDLRRIFFQGKRIALKENPRKNICEECGRKYPDELSYQTSVHHVIYDPADPLAHTKELCNSCHCLGDRNPKRKYSERIRKGRLPKAEGNR